MKFDTALTFNLGHLIELGLLLTAILASYFKLDKRLALLEQKVELIWQKAMED